MTRLRWTSTDTAVAFALAVAVVMFSVVPEIDLQVARLFWRADTGFTAAQHPWVVFVYDAAPRVGRLILLGIALCWLVGLVWPQRIARRLRLRAALLLGTAVFGLGLFIDIGLKDHWGRHRPRDTIAFGGTQSFQPPLMPGGTCRRNCSFVSGHAAVGFFVLTAGMLCGPRGRRRWLMAAVVAGSLIGLGRMVQGGHYLSDIVFSFFAVWLSAHAVWASMLALQRGRAWRRASRLAARSNGARAHAGMPDVM